MNITYTTVLAGVDWEEMKAAVAADDFDNGRTPDQWGRSPASRRVAPRQDAGTARASRPATRMDHV
ncbi:MAG: hypothetical protein IPM02_14530 [Betaproteobacteria bacterium]|nr:hypothetical protein [Betaproteobacteria bacterium]